MYLTAAGNLRPFTSPATSLPLVLLLQPSLQRLEVLEQRAPLHLPLTGHRLQRVRPRLAGAEREHLPQALAGFLAAVERALVQRAFLAGGLAHRPVELELQKPREEVPRVRDVCRDVVLGARIEVLFRARDRRGYALVPGAQRPPGLVVLRGRRLSAEYVPAPLVDQLAEGQERDLGERVLHLEVDHRLLVALDRRDEAELLQISGRHREDQRVADGLVEAVVRSALIEERQLVIGMEVIVVPELVVDGGELLLGRRVADAHLDPQVVWSCART